MKTKTLHTTRAHELAAWSALAAYALALVVATHWPLSGLRANLPLRSADKWAHLAAYAGLTLLALVATAGRRGSLATRLLHPLGRRGLLVWLGVLLFGAIEEYTQPLSGRSCDLFDWGADVAGATLAVALLAALRALYLFRETQRHLLRVSSIAGLNDVS